MPVVTPKSLATGTGDLHHTHPSKQLFTKFSSCENQSLCGTNFPYSYVIQWCREETEWCVCLGTYTAIGITSDTPCYIRLSERKQHSIHILNHGQHTRVYDSVLLVHKILMPRHMSTNWYELNDLLAYIAICSLPPQSPITSLGAPKHLIKVDWDPLNGHDRKASSKMEMPLQLHTSGEANVL